ncbi:hypothetical protein GCM10027517_38110 [Phycicoccus ginsengisoli]
MVGSRGSEAHVHAGAHPGEPGGAGAGGPDRADARTGEGSSPRRGAGRQVVVVVLAALVVGGLAAVGLRAVAPYTDAYHRRPLLLVGPFDAGQAQIALWALVWLAATAVGCSAVVAVRRLARGRLRGPAVVLTVLAAAGVGAVAAGCLALLGVQWSLSPTYTRLSVTDVDGRHWVVAEQSGGFAPVTSWRVYRGGPFVYDEVPRLYRQADGRVTPIADGDYAVRVDPDGTPVLRFAADGPQSVPLR